MAQPIQRLNLKVHAVNGISFKLHHKETLGLVGESGCGKSTAGRTIIRLYEATSGEAKFFGRNIYDLNKKEMMTVRRDMQMIFQDPYASLNPRMTVGDIIGEALDIHHLASGQKRTNRIYELLETVGLNSEHANRFPHEFSGGQRQRIVIARALTLNPDFVVFDESVSALDVSVQAQVLNLINDLKREFGFTAVFISHDLSVIRYLCDRVMVMEKGRIVETGNAEAIYRNPKTDYTKTLIDAIPGKGMVNSR